MDSKSFGHNSSQLMRVVAAIVAYCFVIVVLATTIRQIVRENRCAKHGHDWVGSDDIGVWQCRCCRWRVK